jgi:Reverse transcriptase (RNA-dependent DNA polymerase)/gag-polypeptide of LTR copia-type/GAG-pre-integrase domain
MAPSYKVSKPLVLTPERKWSEWLARFIDAVEAYEWKDQLTDSTKTAKWPLAKDMLLTSTEIQDHPRIRACTNLKDALEALKDAHHVSTQVDAIQLLKELHDIKLRPDEDVRSVVSRVETICNNLVATGRTMDAETKLTHVINILSQHPTYKVTLDHMLATATSAITLKDLVRGFNVMHARATVIPGALMANGGRDETSPFDLFFEKVNAKLDEGMANLAKRVEKVENVRFNGGRGNNNRGRGNGGRGGYGNGGRGGRGNDSRNNRAHPYRGKAPKFDGNCDNCGKYGHKARVCYLPCKICNETSHNVTRCPKNSRAPSNQNGGQSRNENRGGYTNRTQPRANMAQASGYLYNAFHEEEPSNDHDDFVPSAHVAHGGDVNAPPGFGGRTLNSIYGKAMNVLKYKTSSHTWILDGGATHHMTPLKSILFDYVPDTEPMYVKVAIDQWAKRAGVGSIKVHTKVNGVHMTRIITDVWYMPTFDNSLLSANQLKDRKHWVISGRNGDMNEYVFDRHDTLWLTCKLYRGLNVPIWALEMNTTPSSSKVLPNVPNTFMPTTSIPPPSAFVFRRDGKFNHPIRAKPSSSWKVVHNPSNPPVNTPSVVVPTHDDLKRKVPSHPSMVIPHALLSRANVPTDKETPQLWHQRLGHVGMESIQYLLRHNAISGITIPIHEFTKCSTYPCEVCIMAKHRRAPHLKELPKPVESMVVASSDICGPLKIKTMNSCVYVLTFVEWFTQHVSVALLQKKSDAFKELQRIILMHENLLGKKLKHLFTDRGGEYVSESLNGWFAEKGIVHDFSVAHTPQQNGVAERVNQTLMNMIRAMMLQYKSYPPLWGEALMYATRIKNCTLNKKLGMTPHEALNGKVPSVTNFRTFGCLVYARVAECDRAKLDPKSIPGIYLGPELNGPGYRVLVYKPEYKRAHKYAVQVFRDIVCFESLKTVTGASNVTDLHWGGHVSLPTPIENLELEKDSENQISHHGAKTLPSDLPNINQRLRGHLVPTFEEPVGHPPLPLENGEHRLEKPLALIPSNGGRINERVDLENGGSREGNLNLISLTPPHTRIESHVDLIGPSSNALPVPTSNGDEDMSRTMHAPPHREELAPRRLFAPPPTHASPPLHVPSDSLPSSHVPPNVIRRGGIQRMGAALKSVGMKRRREEPMHFEPSHDDMSDLNAFLHNLNLEFDPIAPAAYAAHAPFNPPPSDMLPTRDELVEGLLRSFNVPDHLCGPLPVLTQVDPKNPPNTLKQAMSSKYAKFWAMATVDEWMSIMANNTWELVDKEPWMKIIPCKWVFVVKVDEKGIPTRFKARLVAGGHRQVEGIDYDETYAPVSRMTTLRILLGVSASKGWVVHQLDIKTAFLHGKADLDIYMRQPSGFEDGMNAVCKLRKTLYGLKQAPRAWYFVLKGVLNDLGFEQMSADSSFWVHKTHNVVVFLTSIVDDMLIVSPDETYTLKLVHNILEKLPGTHSGRASYYNGLRITWLDDTKEVLLTQASHVEKLYEKFMSFMDTTKKRSLPGKETLRICKSGSNFNMVSHELDVIIYKYRELIGGISYITHCSRPDAIHVCNQLAKVSNLPMWEHWSIALELLSFLYNSRYYGVKFGGYDLSPQVTYAARPIHLPHTRDPPVVGYADANFGTGIDDKRSISGHVIKILGGPVSWASRSQSLTAASSTESEFRALSECSREALWVAKLLDAFDIPCKPFLIRGDSQGALSAIKNYQYTKYTKHVEIVHDFMKDRYQAGVLKYEYVQGDLNPADIFTKCLGKHKFELFRSMLGMAELPRHLR